MSRVRVVFMGTPEFAVPALRTVLADEHYEVVGVVTQPDRPAGRKLELKPSPVKQLAVEHGIPVLSPEKINRPEELEKLAALGAEVAVVVAFGQLLSRNLLSMFRFGCVNVHGSLLPKWRGAAPMQRALMAGDKETGVCLQRMVFELDAGDILGERRLAINDDMDARDLHHQLSALAGELLHVELMDYIRGNLVGKPQDESLVTIAPKIKKEESNIDWGRSAQDIFNHVRGLTLGPVAFTVFNKTRLKIWRTRRSSYKSSTQANAGSIRAQGSQLFVRCGDDQGDNQRDDQWLELLDVQPESKKMMPAAEFIRGYGSTLPERFGL